LRPDNTAERLLAVGDVRGDTTGESPTHLRARQGDFQIGARNAVQSGILSGGVYVRSEGKEPSDAKSDHAYLTFGPNNQLSQIRAVRRVQMVQHRAPSPDGQPQQTEVDADAVDFVLKPGNQLDYADTRGRARIVILSSNAPQNPASNGSKKPKAPGPVRTTVTARTFHAIFNADNRMQTLHGAPNARILSLTPGEPQRVSTSRVLDVSFSPTGEVSNIVQTGNVHYVEAQREAWADQGTYAPGDGNLLLTGSPRVVDGGTTTTADTIRMVRPTGDAFAQGEVKSTYSELKASPEGAMLASSDPIHVTSESMTANRNTGLAVYTGRARLWQDGNTVDAPTITFDHNHRSVLAKGSSVSRVETLFVQEDATGKTTPVNVTSNQLTYLDERRQALFTGSVVARSADGTLTSDRATVLLLPKGQKRPGSAAGAGPDTSRVDRIIADGHVVIVQPNRRGQGDHLVYTAADGKFVLTGGPPTIFDAERGTVRGRSLTFFNRDDRVLVESRVESPTISQTRVAK
jgi:lipopolysaccharide export system protein LptA